MINNTNKNYSEIIEELHQDFLLLKNNIEIIEKKLSYLKASTKSTDIYYKPGLVNEFKSIFKKWFYKFFHNKKS